MNDRDLDNLEFLLTISSADLEAWYQTLISQGELDDIEYATQLIQIAQAELELRLLEIHDDEANEDLSQAVHYLTRFRLQ